MVVVVVGEDEEDVGVFLPEGKASRTHLVG